MQTVREHIRKIRQGVGEPPRSVGLRLEKRQQVGRHGEFDNAAQDEAVLLSRGRVVWAHVIQADDALKRGGKKDLPAIVVYSLDDYFDGRISSLTTAAAAIKDLKGRILTDPALDHLAEALTNMGEPLRHSKVPHHLPVPSHLGSTRLQGLVVHTMTVHRKLLPTKKLTLAWFPILVLPEATPYAMVVSFKYWPRLLVKLWRSFDS